MADPRVALITGAGSGIGLATALQMAKDGIAIVGVGRDETKLDLLRAALPDLSRVATIALDVTHDDSPARAVQFALERFGRLDILLNNAGIGRPKAVHDSTDEILDFYLDVLLLATLRFARAAIGAMKNGGVIINVTSTYAILGGINGGAYSAGKAGLVGLTRHIAAAYGARGIRSNAVAPGVIPTAMTEGRWENPQFQRMNNEMTPLDRMGTSEDVSEAICFLCSEEGAFINGQVIAIDGGWSSTKYLAPEALFAQRLPQETT